MNSEILREAHFYEDVEVDIRTAVDDNDRQAKDIRELIAEGVDLLIVAPNEATPITPVSYTHLCGRCGREKSPFMVSSKFR